MNHQKYENQVKPMNKLKGDKMVEYRMTEEEAERHMIHLREIREANRLGIPKPKGELPTWMKKEEQNEKTKEE